MRSPATQGEGHSSRHWKMAAQRRLRQVLAMLEDESAEPGDAFELLEDAEAAIEQLQQQREVGDG
ncbi:MAG: hypothetical protein NXI35_33145 [bacterium]|nr:hypothetical protein [bacterium]